MSLFNAEKCPHPTLYALGTDYVGGLVGRILHPGTCDAKLLNDAVQEPLHIVLGHLVGRAGCPSRNPAELQAEEEEEEEEAEEGGAEPCHLRGEAGRSSANAALNPHKMAIYIVGYLYSWLFW